MKRYKVKITGISNLRTVFADDIDLKDGFFIFFIGGEASFYLNSQKMVFIEEEEF